MIPRYLDSRLTFGCILLLCVVVLVFVCDGISRRPFSDPLQVSKHFCWSYMIRDAHHMLRWASEEIHESIDSLGYPEDGIPSFRLPDDSYHDLHLVSLERLGHTIVTTYRYWEDLDSCLLFYTCVMNPVASASYWERFKDFLYYDVPLGSSLFSTFPAEKQRWLVTDFFSEDNVEDCLAAQDTALWHLVQDLLAQDTAASDSVEWTDEQWLQDLLTQDTAASDSVEWTDEQWDVLLYSLLGKEYEFAQRWSRDHMREQNARARSLYTDYLKFQGDTMSYESKR